MADMRVSCFPAHQTPMFADRVLIENVSLFTEKHESLGKVFGIEGTANGKSYKWAVPMNEVDVKAIVVMAAHAVMRTLRTEKADG